MKKLLLASVLAIASFPGYAHAGEADCDNNPKSKACSEWRKRCPAGCTTHLEDARAESWECGDPGHEWGKSQSCPIDNGQKDGTQFARRAETECGALENKPPCPNATAEDCLDYLQDREVAETPQEQAYYDQCMKQVRANKKRARVTVAPPYQGLPPIGWVYQPYTRCLNFPQCTEGVVNVQADGLNVRITPNGPPVMALVNGTPLIPVRREGNWLLVAAGCDLTPTWLWSWTANVPLNRCWVYF